jgi:hypothetical protein
MKLIGYKQNKTKQNKTEQTKTKQNKTKQNKTKQNKTKHPTLLFPSQILGYLTRYALASVHVRHSTEY